MESTTNPAPAADVEVHAPAFTARQCPACDTWVYVADGPFAEGDPTKPLAGAMHYDLWHATAEDRGRVGIPYMRWNTEPVRAVREAVEA